MSEPQLYQKRIPVYPRSVQGRYRRIKTAVLVLAYGVYFLLPWLRWNRPEGIADQAVLYDLPGRRFYLFDLVVQIQDIFWLAGLLIIAAMLLFMVTGIAGRVFCGYFCFQTLWTDVFMTIERWVQGERPARIRLAQAPWSVSKGVRYLVTWTLWLGVSLATGVTFTLYWADAPTLIAQMLSGSAPFPAYATTVFLTTTTFVMAGLAREQVCLYMCPYARFQSAMFDRDTLIVAYDQARGEGAHGRARPSKDLRARDQRQAAGVGDCIDCGYCVQVCPTGIDIRNGLQLGCIHCALCIDACDTIMDNLGWPKGLIRYSSENEQSGGKTRFLTFKTVGYGVVLVAAVAALSYSIASQAPLDAVVSQVRQPLFVTLSDGRIQNSYELKFNNKTLAEMTVTVSLNGLPDAELEVLPAPRVALAPEQRLRVLARVKRPAGSGAERFEFVVRGAGDTAPLSLEAAFSTP